MEHHSRKPALPSGWSTLTDSHHHDPYQEFSSRSGINNIEPNFNLSVKYADRYGNMPQVDATRIPHNGEQAHEDSPRQAAVGHDETTSQIKTRRRRDITRVLSKYAEKASLNGVTFIGASKNPYVKTIWSILLAAAIGAMIYHLYSLLSSFLEYKKQTKVSLSFSSLQFPAVTVCNINILRKSMVNETSKEIREYVENMTTRVMLDRLGACSDSEYDEEDCWDESDDTSVVDKSFYDQTFPDSWESEGQQSSFTDVFDKFRNLMNGQPLEKRQKWGHQIEDMLLHCSFAGKKCYAKNFTHFISGTYGNCFTLQYSKFISRKAGPDGGLELVFFLENHEFLEGITTGSGIHVVIHEQKTTPFPEDEGIAIAPATQTIIGMKQVQIERLGSPYGPCKAVNSFEKKYNVTYTRTTCQKICEQNLIRSKCNCTDGKSPNLNVIMGPADLEPCKSTEQIKCFTKMTFDFDSKNNLCDCDGLCRERGFEQSISSRQWPSLSFSRVLVETVCKNVSNDTCDLLKERFGQSSWELVENFIKLNIYYKDLNYELLKESPDYEMVNLWSDIGGTIGLWIGLSVLGVCELLFLLVQVLIKCCDGGKRKQASESRHTVNSR
ncbi:unnamed protein product [Lymnaea stagnalis]|uniref:Uncharacterized protein n=1 Tax=Lymnaea stagnalis TaxID=6523 RepID=A0AAV2I744_LYMST